VLTVKDVLITNIITAEPDWSVSRVIELMLEEDISSLLIVDQTERLVGLVTESALLVAAFDPQLSSDPISLHMERRFVSIHPDEPIFQVLEKFLLHRVRHFPVLENGRLLGIVTRRELMRAMLGRKTVQNQS